MTRSHDDERDAEHVRACADGSAEALEHLYRRHAVACLSHARSVLVDPHHAEDAVQEAFLDLWRWADRFDAGRATARSWLLMLTHRKAVDRVRSEQRRRTEAPTAVPEQADSRPGPDALAITAMLGRQAQQALAQLTPVKRQAVVLAYWGGYTQREIAGLTDAPLGTVKTRTREALRDLHTLMVRAGAVSPAPQLA